MSSQKLSQVLKGKTGLSTAAASSLADHLELKDKERDLFLSLVEFKHGRSKLKKTEAEKKVRRLVTALAFQDMSATRFSPFMKWEYVSIYIMAERPDFEPDPAVLAKRLGITKKQAEQALTELIEANLLRKDKFGKWHPEDASIHIRFKNTFEGIRNYYRSLLQKAVESLDTHSTDRRYNSAAILNVGADDLEFAKKEIDSLRQKLVRDLSLRGSKNQKIYCLSLQLFQIENT